MIVNFHQLKKKINLNGSFFFFPAHSGSLNNLLIKGEQYCHKLVEECVFDLLIKVSGYSPQEIVLCTPNFTHIDSECRLSSGAKMKFVLSCCVQNTLLYQGFFINLLEKCMGINQS